ncbi:Heat shock 70 kDa protein BIP2 [Linum perenne]
MVKVKAEIIEEEEEDVKPAISRVERGKAVKKEETNGDGGGADVVIGIDLGTTNSCVAVAVNGRVEIIANDQGNRTTPSSVAFSSERLIGEAAKNQATLNPRRTVFDVKRLIGKKFDNPEIQRDLKYLPYTVVNRDGKAYVELEVKPGEEVKAFSPEEISAMVLGKMKETAESYLGKPVGRAVVTVPAYFNDAQRQATKDAGTIAGLEVVQIINEPTAAAIAYGFKKQNQLKRKRTAKSKIVVYDLGGGTFDVSVLEVQGREFRVLATGGDTHLGGGDFDRRVMEYFINLIKRKYKGKDISGDSRALGKLRKECERAKRGLSNLSQVRVEIDSFLDGGMVDFSEPLSRAKFEELNMDLFEKTLEIVKSIMEDGKVKINEIEEIVLVGGSTRIVKVREMLKEMFNGKEPNQGVNPDEAVAFGAAVLGAKLSSQANHSADYGVTLIDVTPLNLGIYKFGGLMSVVIPRNTVIPAKMTKNNYTAKDQQAGMRFKVHIHVPLSKDCVELGMFGLEITPAPRGVTKVVVTFELDVNGILTVTAKERTPLAKSKSLTIIDYKGYLTEAEIERMTREAKMMAEEDQLAKARVEAMNALERYIYDVKTAMKKPEIRNMISSDEDRGEEWWRLPLKKLRDG